MEEKILLEEILTKTAKTLKKEKQDSLSKTLLRGKVCLEIREKLNCYNNFKLWVEKTGYSISTINRDINRYELHELMQKEIGKRTVEKLSVILLAWINKLQTHDEEKYIELVSLIDNGLDKKGIKGYLEENITEESTQFRGEELREYFEELKIETSKIDIRKVKSSIKKKIMKAVVRVFNLISGCTKLDIVKRNKDMRKKMEEINYGIGVLSIS